MLSSLIRMLQAWKDYGTAVRELSGLNDRELADLGISRSDIDWVARQNARD
jgi:uncharacterized protein YjiS (DUF1127 family)